MGRNKEVSAETRQKILQFYDEGNSMAEIGRRTGLHRWTVSRILKKYDARGHLDSAPRSGQPRVTSEQVDRAMRRLSVADPTKTATDLRRELSASGVTNCSTRTIRRRLCSFGLYGRHAVKKPYISRKNQMARYRFARDHVNWTREQWEEVIFSDESKFQIFGSDGYNLLRCFIFTFLLLI